MVTIWRLSGLFFLLLSGCVGTTLPPAPPPIALGDVLLDEDFSQPFRWQTYQQPTQNVDFRPENGVYRAQAWDGGFSWALHDAATYADVVMQVDTEQLSAAADNAYGVLCRASATDNGDGYYFFISGDGHYTIRVGTRAGINDLIPWMRSPAIQTGRAINRVRVACVGNWLALWVNGELIASTRDDRFTSGYLGLTAAVPDGGEVDVTFDAVRVWAGRLTE